MDLLGRMLDHILPQRALVAREMVLDAPVFADIAHDFLSFIGDSILVAHNSGFDMRFLNSEIGLVYPDYRMANPCLCTVQLSRKLLPDITNHKLKTVAEHYSIDLVNHHRANADTNRKGDADPGVLALCPSGGHRAGPVCCWGHDD